MNIGKLKDDLKCAMKVKDKSKVDLLRMVISRAQLDAKESKKDLNNTIVLESVKKELKENKDSLDSMRNSLDSVSIEDYEYKIEVLQGYLPKQIDTDSLVILVNEEIENICLERNIKSMGKLMGILKSKLGDTVDNKKLSEVVKKELTK